MVVGEGSRMARRRSSHSVLLLTGFVINTMTISLSVLNVGGLPIRIIVSFAVLIFCILTYQRTFVRVLTLHRSMLLMLLGFGLLGVVVSGLNGTELTVIAQEVAAIHVQGAVNLLLAAMLVELCGAVPVATAFVAAVALSAVVAVFQFIDIEAAWQVRRELGQLQGIVTREYDFLYDKRPMGLSYSPITLATQLCLAFAALGIVLDHGTRTTGRRRRVDKATLIAALLFCLACVFSGNRSPILGMVAFFFLYFARQKRAMFWVIGLPITAAVLVILVPLLSEALQQSSLRVAEVGDKSSTGRITLLYYGLLLFINHPFGYGLDFDPTRYWRDYWPYVSDMPNAAVISEYPLHNYLLSMLNFYGVGMLSLVPLMWLSFRQYGWTLLFFVPYLLHIMFHNAGPFFDDALIWTVLAVAAGLRRPQMLGGSPATPPTPARAVPSGAG